ncbi:MAG: hypothetical protein LBS40_04005 [Burkholderiales bacterium]|jgi:hypothetical protein|nr:hypothetical protein [Burkholderiales bacterium]
MRYIVSSIPGRMRIRHSELKDARRFARIYEALSSLENIREIIGNRTSGSLLIFYDAKRTPQRKIENDANQILKTELSETTVSRRKRYTSTTLKINRYAKYGMYGSLGLSLLMAAISNKRAHAVTGLIFTGCLATHLAIHRHRLLS